MQSHELAKQLLELPDMPVRLYTDHGQTSSSALQIDHSFYSKEGDCCYAVDGETPRGENDDEVDVIEIYGE